jgi:tight adherence protein B
MILALFFAVIFATCVSLVLFASKKPLPKKVLQARLTNLAAAGDESQPRIQLTEKSKRRWSDRIGEWVQSYHFGESLEALIVHSGVDVSVGKVLVIGAGLAFTTAFIVHWFLDPLWVMVPVAALGASLPYAYLAFKRSRRLGKFNSALPDAIDLMSRALRAGHSVGSSIEVIAQQSPQPLAGEFEICFQQQKFGVPFRDALLDMGERVHSDDLQFLITAVLVQKETGGDLTDILDRTTAVIRDRIRIQGEVRTRTAQGRLTGWILSGLPIVMLVIINIIRPGYSHVLFYDPIGQKLMMAGAAFILIGAFIISRIVDIKV